MNQTLFIFSLVAFIGIATPGPTVLLALANGSRHGVRASVPGMVGAMLSDFVLIAAVAVGLGALLSASEFWFSVVKWVGVAYLAYLGVRMLGSRGMLALPAEAPASTPPSRRAIFLRSFLVAVTNPKGYLFFSAFLPQFIAPAQPQPPQYAKLAVTFAAIDFGVIAGLCVGGCSGRPLAACRGCALAGPPVRRGLVGSGGVAGSLSPQFLEYLSLLEAIAPSAWEGCHVGSSA